MEFSSWMRVDESVEVQMPNEIFDDLSNADFNSFNHKCFAYAYYYLVSYIYRNALYGIGEVESYTQQNIIGVFTSNKSSVSYITKSGGLLDKIGYTRTTTDYPISYYMDADGNLEFGMIKELRKRMPDLGIGHNPRFSVKEPIKAVVRYDDEHYTGTFYGFQNTHRISADQFIKIASDKKLGHVGLYVYGYLSMMCDRFPRGYQIMDEELAAVVGAGERTIQRYTSRLEEIGMIGSSRELVGKHLLHKAYTII